MTEEQIKDGYDRLDGALAPPLDAEQRVQRRVTARRRQRRTAVAGVATLGVLAIGGTVVALAGGDDGSGPAVANDTTGDPVSTLVLTRPDGSTYAFEGVEVTCNAPEGEDGTVGPQRISAFSPKAFKDHRAVEPFVTFDGIVSKIAGDQTFTFPNDWTMGTNRMPMVLFAADTDGNEVASSAGGESGTVRVVEASCGPTPVLRLEVDMTLGSEVEKDPLKVAGSLR
jgi:hypothetical protein